MTPNPHILVAIPTLYRGGAERVLARLSFEWVKTHGVTIVAFDGRDPGYEVGGEICDLKFYGGANLPVKLYRVAMQVIHLIRLIHKIKPSHLIGFMEYANFPLILAALFTGNLTRTIVSVRNNPNYFPWLQRVRLAVLYQLPRRIVVVSVGVKRELVAMGIPSGKIEFIPNPAPDVI